MLLIIGIVIGGIATYFLYSLLQKLTLQEYKKDAAVAQNKIENAEDRLEELTKDINKQVELLKSLENKRDEMLSALAAKRQKWVDVETMCQQAFEIYAHDLMENYEQKEEEYNTAYNNLNKSYQLLQDQVIEEQQELEHLRNIRFNIIKTGLEAKMEEEQQNYYKLSTPPHDNEDIGLLLSIKDRLYNSSLVLKVIWSQFRQKQLKELFTKILGNDIHSCGIYKITNVVTGEPYIGQARDLYERWMQHAKNACGVGNTVAGDLYKNMQKYGLDNFTWEVLEYCEPNELNAKEKAYINIYCSKEYGLNGTVGGS